jgi:DNA-binding transcriptional MocR family regulator
LRRTPWNGLLLGYSQVPAQEMNEAVRRLARVAHQTGGSTFRT